MSKPPPIVRPPVGALLLIAYLGFISLGLPDAVAGIAWPDMRDQFGLPQSGLGLIFIASGVGYFCSSFFGGRLTHALGLGTLLTVSSLLVGLAMVGSGLSLWFAGLIAAALVWGVGSGAIDAGLNTYAANNFSPRHVSWLHACYSFGAMLGPLVMTACIVQAGSWQLGYMVVGAAMLGMTALFLATRQRWTLEPGTTDAPAVVSAPMLTVLASPLVWLQTAVFFFYTGLEATVGQWSYTLLTEQRGVETGTAGVWVATYFGSLAAGRVLFGIIAERVGLDRLVRLATLGTLLGALMFAAAPYFADVLSPAVANGLGLFGLALIGLGLSPIFPCLMARTPARLSLSFAAHAIGFQVSAATLGAASMPGLTGILCERISLESAAIVALVLAALLGSLHEVLLARSRATMH